MFIGHYAIAIGASSVLEKRRGVLPYIALSSLLPDILMLLSQCFGYSQYHFHSLKGQVVCSAIIIVVGLAFKFKLKTFAVAIASTFFHLVCDIPYSETSNNLYSHHKLDFAFEAGLLTLSFILFFYQTPKNKRSLVSIFALFISLALLQGLWNFVLSS